LTLPALGQVLLPIKSDSAWQAIACAKDKCFCYFFKLRQICWKKELMMLTINIEKDLVCKV